MANGMAENRREPIKLGLPEGAVRGVGSLTTGYRVRLVESVLGRGGDDVAMIPVAITQTPMLRRSPGKYAYSASARATTKPTKAIHSP